VQELQTTPAALGYANLEIHRATRDVANGAASGTKDKPATAPSPDDTDAWLKASLRWLSQEAA
jgi:Holliday junction DNA helicase RuvA